MAISYTKITPFNSAFGLVRTNPKLTGNIKLIVDSSDQLYLESIDANAELSGNYYKGFKVDPTSAHDLNVYRFFDKGRTPENIVFSVKKEVSVEHTSIKFEDQYDFSEYFSGARYCTSKNYSEKLKYFAPLHLGESIPENFVIFKIPGASNLPIIDTKNSYPYNKDEHIREILKNATIIKTFDLGSESNIGKYIRRYQSDPNYPNQALYYPFEGKSHAIYSGISYKSGCFSEKFENLQSLHIGGKTISDFEEYVTLGFERQGLLYPFIINLEFLFDDTSEEFEFNRYFGIYCNTIELQSLNFDLSNHALLNINSPRILNATEYEYAQIPITQTNIDGLLLKFEEVPTSVKNTLTELDNLGVIVINDKSGQFHKITEVNPDLSQIRLATKSLDLSLLHGPTELLLEDTGELVKTGLRSFIEITVTDIPNHLDEIRIFFPGGKNLNQTLKPFESIKAIRTIESGSITQVTNANGSAYAESVQFKTSGQLSPGHYYTVIDYQGGGQTVNSTAVTLTVGNQYEIVSFAQGDDFLNTGAESTEVGYKFKAQSLVLSETVNGELVQGKLYKIKSFVQGDDFTRAGADSNSVGQTFIANSSLPIWTNGSVLTDETATTVEPNTWTAGTVLRNNADDFSNVAQIVKLAPGQPAGSTNPNVNGTTFIATGQEPTVWSNGTRLAVSPDVTSGKGYGATLAISTVGGASAYSLPTIEYGGTGYQVGDILQVFGTSLNGTDPDNFFTCEVAEIDAPAEFDIRAGEYKAIYQKNSPDQYYFSINTLETDTLDNRLTQIATALAGAINSVKNAGCSAYSYKNRIFIVVNTPGDAAPTHAIQYIPASEEIKIKVSHEEPYSKQASVVLSGKTSINLDLATSEYLVYGEARPIINQVIYQTGSIISGINTVSVSFSSGSLSETYLVGCPIIKFENGSLIDSHVSVSAKYRDKIHENLNTSLIQSAEGWAVIKNVVRSIDKINELTFSDENLKISAVNYYDANVNLITEDGTNAIVTNKLFQIRKKFKPDVKLISFLSIKDFDFDKIDSQYTAKPNSDLWKTAFVPEGINMINLGKSSYKVYNGEILLNGLVYGSGDIIERPVVNFKSKVNVANPSELILTELPSNLAVDSQIMPKETEAAAINPNTQLISISEKTKILSVSNIVGTPPPEQTSGSLKLGHIYKIVSFNSGDDFSNLILNSTSIISGTMNQTGCVFKVTVSDSQNTSTATPTSWTAATVLIDIITSENVTQNETSGSGKDATFTIVRDQTALPIYTVTITNPGSGYLIGDSIKILGTKIGGDSPENDIEFIVGETFSSVILSKPVILSELDSQPTLNAIAFPGKMEPTSFTKISGDPFVIPCISQSNRYNTLDVELAETLPDISAFKGFFTLTTEGAVDQAQETEVYLYRDRYSNGTIGSEYDANYERYIIELEKKNRLVKYVCKWGADGSLDARSNPYRLNSDLAFGVNNFSPDSTKTEANSNLLTHEWFYIESLYDYIFDQTAAIQNKSYFESPFDLDLALTDPNYFDDYFIYTPAYIKNGKSTPIARAQYRFSNIIKEDVSGLAKTIFKGAKYVFKERDLDSTEFELSGAPKYIRDSNRFEDYRFTILLKTIKDEPYSGKNPIQFKFVESVDFKFIILIVELRLFGKNLELTSPIIGNLDEEPDWTNKIVNSLTLTKTESFDEGEAFITDKLEESFSDYKITFNSNGVSDINTAFLYYAKNKKFNINDTSYSSINLTNSLDLSQVITYNDNPRIFSLDKGTGVVLTDEIVSLNENSILSFKDSAGISFLGSVIAERFSLDFPIDSTSARGQYLNNTMQGFSIGVEGIVSLENSSLVSQNLNIFEYYKLGIINTNSSKVGIPKSHSKYTIAPALITEMISGDSTVELSQNAVTPKIGSGFYVPDWTSPDTVVTGVSGNTISLSIPVESYMEFDQYFAVLTNGLKTVTVIGDNQDLIDLIEDGEEITVTGTGIPTGTKINLSGVLEVDIIDQGAGYTVGTYTKIIPDTSGNGFELEATVFIEDDLNLSSITGTITTNTTLTLTTALSATAFGKKVTVSGSGINGTIQGTVNGTGLVITLAASSQNTVGGTYSIKREHISQFIVTSPGVDFNIGDTITLPTGLGLGGNDTFEAEVTKLGGYAKVEDGVFDSLGLPTTALNLILTAAPTVDSNETLIKFTRRYDGSVAGAPAATVFPNEIRSNIGVTQRAVLAQSTNALDIVELKTLSDLTPTTVNVGSVIDGSQVNTEFLIMLRNGPISTINTSGIIQDATAEYGLGRTGSATIYTNINLNGGSGSGAKATVSISLGLVSSITVTSTGSGYAVGDVLIINSTDIVGFSATNRQGTVSSSTLTLSTALPAELAGESVAVTSTAGTYLGNATVDSQNTAVINFSEFAGVPGNVTVNIVRAGATGLQDVTVEVLTVGSSTQNLGILRFVDQPIYHLDKSSGISTVLANGVAFISSPTIALPNLINLPYAQNTNGSIEFSFNKIIKRNRSVPYLNPTYWENTPFAMLLGGESYYQGLFKYLSFASFKNSLETGTSGISYTTYRNGEKTQGEFYIEVQDPAFVEKLKIASLTQISLQLANNDTRFIKIKKPNTVVGYTATESLLQNPVLLRRHSYSYSPIFREVSAFLPSIEFNGEPIKNANCKFNPAANRFFEVKGFEHIKVSDRKILELQGSDKYEPIFTLVDETPISTSDLYLLASDWDFGFHKYYISKNEKIDVYGSRRIEEDSYFMSKLASLPDDISVDRLSSLRVSQLPSINQAAARKANILYSVGTTFAELDIDITSAAISKVLDMSSISSEDSTATGTTVLGLKEIALTGSTVGTISSGMLVKGAGISEFTTVDKVVGNTVFISRPATATNTTGVGLRFIKKIGLYYQILKNMGISQDVAYPELFGNLNFTTYCQRYAELNIIPSYEIDEIELWYIEETNKPSGITFSQLSSVERFALGYNKLEGAQINIKKGLTVQLRIPLRSTGNLIVNVETKMRFI